MNYALLTDIYALFEDLYALFAVNYINHAEKCVIFLIKYCVRFNIYRVFADFAVKHTE
ncbi:MAG TPA: hypothetical protein VGD05_01640 [Pyrinomonadaceae bacterium]